jgi:3,4-dihydroxy 2-butanone 4-phosphate synthase/GTP cyclohydrolase II
MGWATIEDAIRALKSGRLIVVVDDPSRENEGDLIGAAGSITSEQIAFMVRHTTGIICAPMTAARAGELSLPHMVAHNRDNHSTAFTVTVDHKDVSTGVSAVDRARTLRALADHSTVGTELRRPGHVFPLIARDGGVLVREGHTEATVDLLRLASLPQVGVIGEIVDDDGTMMADERLEEFAERHGLLMVSIADLVRYQRAQQSTVTASGDAELPTEFGHFHAHAFQSTVDGVEHLALTMGEVAGQSIGRDGILVRVHSECITGDLVGSLRCDCGDQFRRSLQLIAAEGVGVLVYLRGHEGRGIGLGHKLQAYKLQSSGMDTIDANVELGLPIDRRDYAVGAEILECLGVRKMRLITNNPGKFSGILGENIEIVSRVALPVHATPQNLNYLTTKRDRMGHLIDLPKPADEAESRLLREAATASSPSAPGPVVHIA